MKKLNYFISTIIIFTTILGGICFNSLAVQAANTVYIAPSGVSYIYNGSNTLTIEGSGVTDDSWKSYQEFIDLNVQNKITTLTVNSTNITEIGDDSFSGCPVLSTVNFSKHNISTIGARAFKDDIAFVKLNGGTSNVANLPNTVRNIEQEAFAGCVKLTTLTINTITATENVTIGSKAFDNCALLKTITLGTAKTGSKNIILSKDTFTECNTAGMTVTVNSLNLADNGAFAGKTNLTSITFPYYTETIPAGICKNCTSLTTAGSLGSATGIGPGAFEGCVLLNQVGSSGGQIILPATVATIGEKAFYGCNKTSLATLNIQNKTTDISIDSLAFGNTALKTVTIGAAGSLNADIADDAFINAPLKTITFNTKTIGETKTFAGKTTTTTVTFPNNTATIPAGIFKDCTALTTVSSYGANTTEIGAEAFRNTAIATISLPNKVTKIGEHAFADCIKLTTFTLTTVASTENVTFGSQTFGDCTLLKTITLGTAKAGSKNITLANDTFAGCNAVGITVTINSLNITGEDVFKNHKTLTSIAFPYYTGIIPANICKDCTALTIVSSVGKATEIGANAFEGCIALHRVGGTNNTIAIPATVLNIGDSAFKDTKVTTLTLATGLQTIGDEAFKDCKSLSAIKIPNTTTVIGDGAFEGCSAAKTLVIDTIATTENVSVGNRAFGDCILLNSITLGTAAKGSKNMTITADAFDNCTAANMNVTVNTLNLTAEGLFQNKDNLVTITFPYYTGAIPAYLCKDCTGLTKVASLGNATGIGESAFEGCILLKQIGKTNDRITLPSSITTIGNKAFDGVEVTVYPYCENVENKLVNFDKEYIYSFLRYNENTKIRLPDDAKLITPGAKYNKSIDNYVDDSGNPDNLMLKIAVKVQKDQNEYIDIINGAIINGKEADVRIYPYIKRPDGGTFWKIYLSGGESVYGTSVRDNPFVYFYCDKNDYGFKCGSSPQTAQHVELELHFYPKGTFENDQYNNEKDINALRDIELDFKGIIKSDGMLKSVYNYKYTGRAGTTGYGSWDFQIVNNGIMGIKSNQVHKMILPDNSLFTGQEYTRHGANSGFWIESGQFRMIYFSFSETYKGFWSNATIKGNNTIGWIEAESTKEDPLNIDLGLCTTETIISYQITDYDDVISEIEEEISLMQAEKTTYYEVTRGRAGTGTAALIKNGGTDDYLPILSLKGGDTTEIVPDEQGACSIFKEEKNINAAREIFDDISGGLTATLGSGKTEILGISNDPGHTWYTGNRHLDFKTSDGKDAFIEFCKTTIELKEADNIQDGIKPSIVPAIRLDYNNGEDPDWHNDLVFYTNDAQELSIPEDEDFIGWNTKYNGKGDWYGSETYEENGQTKRRAKEGSLTMDEANTISEKQNTNIGVLYAIYVKEFHLHSNY